MLAIESPGPRFFHVYILIIQMVFYNRITVGIFVGAFRTFLLMFLSRIIDILELIMLIGVVDLGIGVSSLRGEHIVVLVCLMLALNVVVEFAFLVFWARVASALLLFELALKIIGDDMRLPLTRLDFQTDGPFFLELIHHNLRLLNGVLCVFSFGVLNELTLPRQLIVLIYLIFLVNRGLSDSVAVCTFNLVRLHEILIQLLLVFLITGLQWLEHEFRAAHLLLHVLITVLF